MSLVNAQPPLVQYSTTTNGLDISTPKQDYYSYTDNATLIFHVFNQSDGVILTKPIVSCSLHLYNITGDHLLINDSISNVDNEYDFVYYFDTTNLIQDQQVPYNLYCNTSFDGGFISSSLIFNYFGLEPPTDFTKSIFMLAFIILIFAYLITLIKIISTMFLKETDVLDIIYSLGIYFSIMAFNYFNFIYGGNKLIDQITDLFMKVSVFTHVIVPFFAYFFSIIKKKFEEAQKGAIGRIS